MAPSLAVYNDTESVKRKRHDIPLLTFDILEWKMKCVHIETGI
jgi:hypothetical protein